MQVEITTSLRFCRENRLWWGRAKILPKMQHKNKINQILDKRSEIRSAEFIGNKVETVRQIKQKKILLYLKFYCIKIKQIGGEILSYYCGSTNLISI